MGKDQKIHDIRKGEMGRALTKMVVKKWSEVFEDDHLDRCCCLKKKSFHFWCN